MNAPPRAAAKRPRLTPDEFEVLARFIYEVSGIHLELAKAYLIETRLGHLLDELGCTNYSEFHYHLRSDRSKALVHRLVDAITTNETLFFRDGGPFELLRQRILPNLIDRKRSARNTGLKPVIRVWSAACATGQEVYSLAVTAHEVLAGVDDVGIKILGTDISSAAVGQSSRGHYGAFEVERGLPAATRDRYFQKIGHSTWQIRDEIRALCTFRKLNLMEPFGFLGRFDLVLCRNVAIYFRPDDRSRLFERISASLNPGGALLIGASEFLTGVSDRFEARRHMKNVYYELSAPG